MSDLLFFISILYALSGIVYLFIAVRGVLRRNEIRLIDLMRLMYAFIYGFIPFLLYQQESVGERNLYFYDYSDEGLLRILIIWLMSIIAYAALNLAYRTVPTRRFPVKSQGPLSRTDEKYIGRRLVACGCIALAIGWGCLILWTSAYGSIGNFILNAATIRSGRGLIYNRFAFVKQFVRIMPLSLYAFISALYYSKPRSYQRIALLLLISVSFIGVYFYFVTSDSRVMIVYTGMAVLCIAIRHRKNAKIGRYLGIAALLAFILLEATMAADVFTRYVRTGRWTADSGNIISSLTKEFRFTVSSDMRVMKAWASGDLKLQIGNDLLNAITSWIPERFIPFSLPNTLWAYNTNIYGSLGSGTSPTSLVSTSVYEFGIIGPVIYPFIMGRVTARIENFLWKYNGDTYADAYYGLLVGLFILLVSHNQISSFVISLFPAFLFYLITKLVDRVRIGSFRFVKKTG